jgi:hypothetical protein
MKSNIWSYFFVRGASVKCLPEWLRAWTTIVATICVANLLLCLLIICWLLVRLGIDALSASAPTYQETTRNFLLAFASAFGAPFLVWRAWVAHQQARAAAEQARVALENHVTGIFAKSVELMGYEREVQIPQAGGASVVRTVPNIEARLGAIYSLERILRESEKDQRAILETLCAYIRENSPLEVPEDEAEASVFWQGGTLIRGTRRKDVQAAITVVGRRPPTARESLDFKNTNLVGYDFSGRNFDQGDFSRAFMNGTNLTGTSFSSCTFSNTFVKNSQVKDTKFHLSLFEDCDFTNAELDGADFRSATFLDTDLRKARITKIHLEGANLEKAFGYSLEYAVDAIKRGNTNGPYYGQEVLNLYQFFQKATSDDTTVISQHARDAIDMVIQHIRQQSNSDTAPSS